MGSEVRNIHSNVDMVLYNTMVTAVDVCIYSVMGEEVRYHE